METIKVNMSPNPLDVQTIHASQNDGEARQWEFELHNNGELIDTSEVTEQMFFKAYKGGTEEILPTNGSVPTTAPFLGDIRYPQGLLTDQEFTYRQSPTEEDGLAKITDIKGNTLVWNQLIQNGDFRVTTGWAVSGRGTLTVSNNVATITPNRRGLIVTGPVNNIKVGHKYLLSVEVKADSTSVWVGTQYNDIHVRINSNGTNQWQRITSIVSNFVNDLLTAPVFGDNRSSEWTASQIRNFMFIDLTALFGVGKEPTTVEEFTSLFPLSYYAYNTGSLLSFNGNGIKTVGKNLFDFSQFANGTITFENGVLTGTASQFHISYGDVVNNGIELKYPKNTEITISFDAKTEQNDSSLGFGLYFIASENGNSVDLARTYNTTTAIQHITVTIPSNRHIDKLGWTFGSNGQNIWHITNFQVEFGATETSYEPYTSSTLSLPISTYFPTGMKSAGTVYDELTPTKAVTRVGAVDLGSLTWVYESSIPRFYTTDINALIKKPVDNYAKANAISSIYENTTFNQLYATEKKNMTMAFGETGTFSVINTSYTDVNAFKTAMSGVYLYYELATPTETPITTASLVTENAEIPLSNEDGTLIGKCTEQLSENPGFIDAKIKLSDGDGECYSNKIQLHIERSPQ